MRIQEASRLARSLRIPRLYIAANSGARIGLAEEIKALYKIAWVDTLKPDKVFDPGNWMPAGRHYCCPSFLENDDAGCHCLSLCLGVYLLFLRWRTEDVFLC